MPATAPRAQQVRSARRTAFPAPEHDHATCLEAAIDRARSAFEDKGMKLTRLRQDVFEEIASSHHAVGAYHVLERLAKTGRRLAPISIYRAIDALLDVGVIHRLESRSAFFACHAGHAPDRNQMVLACERCGRVAEVDGEAIFAAMASAIAGAAFSARRTVVEVSGACADCQATQPGTKRDERQHQA